MRKRILRMRESILLMLLASVLVTVIGLVGTASPQANPATTVYLDPPTINGTAIGVNNTVTVNLMIRDADQIRAWQAGLIFNADLLNCTDFEEGEFLKSVGQTNFNEQDINNTAGLIIPHSCSLIGLENNRTGDGRLGYLTFKVKAPGVSDLHLRDVRVFKGITAVRPEIIDVYTVVLDTTAHTVVIVSDSTGVGSGFYGHAFNQTLKEISFNVTGPYPGFSNVTIPKTLLNVSTLDKWKVRIDGKLLGTEERTVTFNGTHYSIYFTYTAGIHKIQITTRISSTISIALSSTSIILGSNVTISGNITAEDYTGRPNATVTILYRPIGAVTWDAINTVKTDQNSNYTYIWTPETGGTHEVMASWEGDEETIGYESDVLTLTVLYVFEPVQDIYVVIETNSTVADFNSIPALNFSQPLKQISFNVTGPYGTTGFSNVTIPKTLLPPPEPPIEWKVVINGTLLSTEERTVTENDNTSIYFTYSKGVNIVEITTRMSSNISLALSPYSIDLGESVTISGNITAEDQTVRPYVNVTIQYTLNGGAWTTLDTVETDANGKYPYPWEPEASGTYEVMTSWEGDNETIGDKSEVQTLTVKQNSTISIALSSTSITVESSVTINGAIDPVRPWVGVTIWYRPSGGAWSTLRNVITYLNGSYSYTWTPEAVGTYEVNATWDGDSTTKGATSEVWTLTVLKKTSTISIALSSTNITKGESVTISGNVTAEDQTVRPYVNVTIQYTLNGGAWTTLDTVETDTDGNYTYTWTPDKAGTYEIKASWEGDEVTQNATSDVLTLKVKGAPGIPIEIVIVIVVAVVVVAAVVVYFVKFRKP